MAETGTYGSRAAALFRLKSAPATVLTKLQNARVAVTRLRSNVALPEKTTPIPPQRAFFVSVHLRDASCAELWYHGRPEPVSSRRREGAVTIIDLEQDPAAYFGTAFEMVQFYVERAAFDEISRNHGASRIGNLSWPFGEIDPVAKYMALSILPALERPQCASSLYVDHALLAVSAYFASAYGGLRIPSELIRGGLAPWQERRAKEILRARLDGEVSLAELARECELSRSHFARAFKQSIGTSPHRWLLARRAEKAKDLLIRSKLSLGVGSVDGSRLGQSRVIQTIRARSLPRSRRRCGGRLRIMLS
jgi:AraC-like DNA-binding protein